LGIAAHNPLVAGTAWALPRPMISSTSSVVSARSVIHILPPSAPAHHPLLIFPTTVVLDSVTESVEL
jgi:hypothetical protein